MKKTILIIITLFSFSSLKADYFFPNLNVCVSEYIIDNGEIIYKQSGDSNFSITSSNVGIIADTYIFEDGFCKLDKNFLGLTKNDYNFLMGFLGLLIGFAWFTGLILIFSRR